MPFRISEASPQTDQPSPLTRLSRDCGIATLSPKGRGAKNVETPALSQGPRGERVVAVGDRVRGSLACNVAEKLDSKSQVPNLKPASLDRLVEAWWCSLCASLATSAATVHRGPSPLQDANLIIPLETQEWKLETGFRY